MSDTQRTTDKKVMIDTNLKQTLTNLRFVSGLLGFVRIKVCKDKRRSVKKKVSKNGALLLLFPSLTSHLKILRVFGSGKSRKYHKVQTQKKLSYRDNLLNL